MNDIQKRASLIDLLKSLTVEAESRADKNAMQAEVYQTELDPFFDRAANVTRQAADFIEHALSSPPNVGEGEQCGNCDGTGRIDFRDHDHKCDQCDGSGTKSTPPHDRATIRREAFEEAAKVAEYFYDNSLKLMPSLQVKIANAIRALKETPA